MVRPNKNNPPTQKPQAPGLEAGGAYQESGEQKAAQKAIPLRDTAAQPPGTPPPGAVAATPEQPQRPMQDPIEAASGFPNTATPLTAPGQNIQRPTREMQISNDMRAAALLKDWAAGSTHSSVILAAQQMEAILRNG